MTAWWATLLVHSFMRSFATWLLCKLLKIGHLLSQIAIRVNLIIAQICSYTASRHGCWDVDKQ